MRSVFRSAGYLLVAVLIAASFAILAGRGEAQELLLQKHIGKGMVCTACHQENPPATAVKTKTCLTCHGPYDKLADKTEGKAAQNPHASHNGELDCDSCHHVHKVSDNYCAQCHQFEFKVP